jgi:hypothetical protein
MAYTSLPKPVQPKKGAYSRVPVAAGVAAAVAGLAWLLAPGAPKAPAPEAPPDGPTLAMPAAAARKLRVEAAAAVPAARARLEAERTPERSAPEGEEGRPLDRPAWAKASSPQKWIWPTHVGIHQGDGQVIRRLVSWNPSNPPEKTLQYSLTVDRVETRLYENEIPAFEARRAAEAQAAAIPRPVQVQAGRIAWAALAARDRAAAAAPGALVLDVPGGTPTPAQFAIMLKDIRAKELAGLKAANGAVSARDVTGKDNMPMAEFTYADGHKTVVPYDPLVFDLKGDGVKTTVGKVLFDLYGHGKADKTQWMSELDAGSGILVFDAKGTGRSGKDGSEVFGDRTDLTGVGRPTGFANGFEALLGLTAKALDEGVLHRDVVDTGVLDAAALAALEKAYGLKIKVGGFNSKPISLAQAGVDAISLSGAPTQRAADFDGQLNDVLVQPGAVFKRRDGSTGTYMNVWLTAKRGNLGLKSSDHLK